MGSLFQSSRVDKSGFLQQFNTIPMLRNCLLETVLNVTKYLHKVTYNVIETVPLHSQVDNTQGYLCSSNWSSLGLEEFSANSDGNITIDMLQRLTSLYIIIQSEFLRRLSLSLCPETMGKCTRKAANMLWDTIENVSWEITRNSYRLMKHYWLYCGYEKQSNIVPIALKQKHIPLQHAELFQTFQELFLTSQEILNSVNFCIKQTEPKIVTISEDEDSRVEVYDKLEEVMVKLAKLLKKSNSQFDTCFKKLMKMCNSSSSEAKQDDAKFVKESVDEGSEILGASYSDVNPQIEDEVFEEVISSDFQISDEEPDSSMIIEEAKNKIWKKHYDVLFSELKNVLSVRAEKVKEREAKALQKKRLQVQECSNSLLLCDSVICGSDPYHSTDSILLSESKPLCPNQIVVCHVKENVSDVHDNFLKNDNNVTELNPEYDPLLIGSSLVTDVSEKCYENRNSGFETLPVKLPVVVSGKTAEVSQFTDLAYNTCTKQVHDDEGTILSEAASLCTVDSFLADSDKVKEENCDKNENSSVQESNVQRLGIGILLGFSQNKTKLMEETFSYDPEEET